jgi:prepilin-type N-terminal cleavage/methylation domain-containing protein
MIKRRGFSLVEILVVVAIVSFIAFLSAHFVIVNDSSFVRAELEKLCSCAFYLQARARLEGKPYTLSFDPEHQSYIGDRETYKLHPAVQFGILKGVKGPPSKSTYLLNDPVTFPEHSITFYPNGVISAGAVYLTDKKHSCLYALTSGIAQVSHIRRYKYAQKWILLS